jgi:hypothetical protein
MTPTNNTDRELTDAELVTSVFLFASGVFLFIAWGPLVNL